MLAVGALTLELCHDSLHHFAHVLGRGGTGLCNCGRDGSVISSSVAAAGRYVSMILTRPLPSPLVPLGSPCGTALPNHGAASPGPENGHGSAVVQRLACLHLLSFKPIQHAQGRKRSSSLAFIAATRSLSTCSLNAIEDFPESTLVAWCPDETDRRGTDPHLRFFPVPVPQDPKLFRISSQAVSSRSEPNSMPHQAIPSTWRWELRFTFGPRAGNSQTFGVSHAVTPPPGWG